MFPDYSDTLTLPIERKKAKELSFDRFYSRVMRLAQGKLQTEADLERYLKSWWCIHYNRPYRDPLLQGYTLEELILEYLDVSYRANPEAYKKAQEAQRSKQDDDSWTEKMAEKYGEELLSPEEQAKHEGEIEEAFEQHAEEHAVDDLLTLGHSVHKKFNVPE